MWWNLLLIILTGHCSSATCQPYTFHFIKEAKTWYDAQKYCKQNYTDLATINNMEDMKQLTKSFCRMSAAAADVDDDDDVDDAWIGLAKKKNASCMKTQDTREWHWSLPGTEYVENEKYWNSGEPSDHECRENCVVMRTGGKWLDVPCRQEWRAICYDGKTNEFFLTEEKMNWIEAQKYCREKYTDLFSGTSQNLRISSDVLDIIKREGDGVFIGLFRDSWKWSDGSKSSFRYWHPELPDTQEKERECASTNKNGWWSNDCKREKPFFCYDDRVILIRENKTWADALDYCREHHDDLVSISNHHMQQWVQERVKMADTPYVWLGMRYTCTLGLWFWVSGQTACYLNWAPGKGMGDCEMSGAMDKEGKWVETSDAKMLNFFCVKN